MYKVFYTDEAAKKIQKLDKPTRLKIKEAVEELALDPAVGKPLIYELKGRWSYRVNDYRIIYRLEKGELVIIILTVGHRKDVYEKQSRKWN